MTFYVGATPTYNPPDRGAIVVFKFEIYRVAEVNPVPEVDWTDVERAHRDRRKSAAFDRYNPVFVVLRPIQYALDDLRARGHDQHLRYQAHRHNAFQVYRDEHYPLCGSCHEPVPCRETLRIREARNAMAEIARWEDPNVCPSCREPFTTRQKTVTFAENTKIPGGAPVTFHAGRRECNWAAEEYEKALGKPPADQTAPLWEAQ